MRSNGITNFPDPGSGGGFQISAGSGVNPKSPQFQAARKACQKYLPSGPGSGPPPSAQALERMVKIAHCMRAHGVPDFPDPRSSRPSEPPGWAGVISDIDGVILVFPSTIDEQSPSFERAAAACAFPLHNH